MKSEGRKENIKMRKLMDDLRKKREGTRKAEERSLCVLELG